MSQRGEIRLISGKVRLITRAVYSSPEQRRAIIESWRLLHGEKMETWWLHIRPFYDNANENQWSKQVIV